MNYKQKIFTRIGIAVFAAIAIASSYALPVLAAGPLGSAKELGLPTKTADDSALSKIYDTALMVAGAIAVIMIIYGGLLYVSSSGDAAKVKTAKNLIIYTLVGVVVVLFAFVIVRFIIGRF